MLKRFHFNITLCNSDVKYLLKSSDPNVVTFAKDIVYHTVLKEFTKLMLKYDLTDEPINYDLVNKAKDNVIKELTQEGY